REDIAFTQQPLGIEPAFNSCHRLDLVFGIHAAKEASFDFADAMLSRHGSAQRHGISGKLLNQRIAALHLFGRRRKHVEVRVRIANVAVNDILAGHLLITALAIITQKLAVARNRYREIGPKFVESILANAIERDHRKRVPELMKALAVGSGHPKPGLL